MLSLKATTSLKCRISKPPGSRNVHQSTLFIIQTEGKFQNEPVIFCYDGIFHCRWLFQIDRRVYIMGPVTC